MPEISVVVSAYNYAAYIAYALQSVQAQSFNDFEVLIVDDGSTDNTRDVVEPFLRDARFQYIYKENGGQASAKNLGASRAYGKYIAFLDADDAWHPGKLALQRELFCNEDVGVVYSGRSNVDSDNVVTPVTDTRLRRGNVLNAMFVDNFVCFSSVMVRKTVFEQCGLFDESLEMGIDFDLWLRVAPHWKFDYVDAPLVQYRTGHGNMSVNTEKRLRYAWQIMDKALADPVVGSALHPKAVREAYAMTHCTQAACHMANKEYCKVAVAFLSSLKRNPVRIATWKSMAKQILKILSLIS